MLNAEQLKAALERTHLADTVGTKRKCASCQQWSMLLRWEKRCDPCREANAPYTKVVYSENKSQLPF